MRKDHSCDSLKRRLSLLVFDSNPLAGTASNVIDDEKLGHNKIVRRGRRFIIINGLLLTSHVRTRQHMNNPFLPGRFPDWKGNKLIYHMGRIE